ncbi:MAG: 4-(cytidine 5'-diphospho)-2-C-methyl-D-erythritol kinase [Alphaproteobacteria bacterium]|nr:4-(cytidine 5'-diphospho)-2-C-methyl-D-erythritol kinase [Alphaproteobacteria bacterium]
MDEIAYAKVNLALHVRGREADGYHRIETVFAFCEDGDRLSAVPAGALTLEMTGPFAAALAGERDNLVLRAARLFAERFRVGAGAALRLAKRLPVASGIGGGSADAAAALRLLDRMWGVGASEAELLPLAAELGADVPACLLSRTLRGEGRGDRLSEDRVPDVAGTPVLLVNPRIPVATVDVFRRWSGADGGPLPAEPAAARNDLEAPACAVAPAIADVLAALRAAGGATLVRMSGSGATCFGLYADEAARDEAAAGIARSHPGWWRFVSRFRAPPVPERHAADAG